MSKIIICKLNRLFLKCYAIGLKAVTAFIISGSAHAFNSEEHSNLVDVGVSLFLENNPDINELLLDYGIKVITDAGKEYKQTVIDAMEFANSQDNCYPSRKGYLQVSFNRKVKKLQYLPEKTLAIPTYLSRKKSYFSLGRLAALYGDYRRTTYCHEGRCFLTQADIPEINSSCLGAISSTKYFQFLASGTVPPIGKAANTFANSVGLDEFHRIGWYGDELFRLANVNDWHFSNAAVAWYVGLHRLALYYVKRARDTGEQKYLIYALHHEANALHAFTDLFAFGHVVVNRGKTAYGIIQNKGLDIEPAFKWSQLVFAMGGGFRDKKGKMKLSLENELVQLPLEDDKVLYSIREDTMESYRGEFELIIRSYLEEKTHTVLNAQGAMVVNLNGNRFRIYGDGSLREMGKESFDIIAKGVKASLNSLLVYFESGIDDDITRLPRLSQYFMALRYLPAYIEKDEKGYFTGRWTSYAGFINDLSSANIAPEEWEACRVKPVSASDFDILKNFSLPSDFHPNYLKRLLGTVSPTKLPFPGKQSKCTEFPGASDLFDGEAESLKELKMHAPDQNTKSIHGVSSVGVD